MEDPLGPRRLVRTLVIILGFSVVVWALYLARRALLLIYVSVLLAVGLTPLVRIIERFQVARIGIRRIPRWLAILALYLSFVVVLAALAFMVLPPVIQQGVELWGSLPGYLDRFQSVLVSRGLISHPITFAEALSNAPQGGGTAVSTVVGTLWDVVGGAIGLVTLLILTFYLLVDRESIFEVFVAVWPPGRRAERAEALREISTKVSAWLGGHAILGAVVGGVAAVGLFFIGVPFYYVLALVTAVGELIPIIGPLIAGTAAVAAAATVSLKVALATLVFFVVLQQIEGNVLVPKVMERQVGLSPAAVMMALMIGGELHGVVGAVLGMPTAAIIKVVYEHLVASRATRDSA